MPPPLGRQPAIRLIISSFAPLRRGAGGLIFRGRVLADASATMLFDSAQRRRPTAIDADAAVLMIIYHD